MNTPRDNNQPTERTKRNAARDMRSDNEAKEAQQKGAALTRRNPLSVSAAMVPPYSYRQPGMTAEAGAVAAVKALGITQAIEALGLLWQLRRVALNDSTPPPLFIQKSKEQ